MKDKIFSFLLNLYYIFAFLSSLTLLNQIIVKYDLHNYSSILNILYIALCGYLLIYKNQADDKIKSDYVQKNNSTAILIDNINKFDYKNLKIIKNIQLHLLKVKITLKDDTSHMLNYNDLYFLKSENDLIDFDDYIYDNYNKEINEKMSNTDKKYEDFYINAMKENILFYLCIKYNKNR